MTGRVWMGFGVSGVRGAEAGIFRAYCWVGGPTSAGTHAYLRRGRLRICRRRSGGKSVGCKRENTRTQQEKEKYISTNTPGDE